MFENNNKHSQWITSLRVETYFQFDTSTNEIINCLVRKVKEITRNSRLPEQFSNELIRTKQTNADNIVDNIVDIKYYIFRKVDFFIR